MDEEYLNNTLDKVLLEATKKGISPLRQLF